MSVSRTLTLLEDIDLKHLSSIYDTTDTFLSVYIPVEKVKNDYNRAVLDFRVKQIRKALSSNRDLLKNFDDCVDELERYLEKGPSQGEKTLAAFISVKNGISEYYRLTVDVDASVILDTSPYIRPLALVQDEWYDFGIVVMDSQNAKICVITSQIMSECDNLSEDIMKHHKKGGQSQMRFQRLRRGAVERFMKEVSEKLVEVINESKSRYWRGIILTGPGSAKKQFYELLPMDVREQVIGTLDMDTDVKDTSLIERASDIALNDEVRKGAANVEYLREAIFRDGNGIYGIDEVIKAAKEGRVELLLLDYDIKIPGFICENCQRVTRTAPKDHLCPECGTPLSKVDMIEEALEFAKRTDADIEFVKDNEFLQSLGGIGAILRY